MQVLLNDSFPDRRTDTKTVYYLYDVAAPDAGSRTVFEATAKTRTAGSSHRSTGIGLASGEINPMSRDNRDRCLV